MTIQLGAILEETIEAIQPVSADLLAKCQAHLDTLTKPIGSLGRLEAIAAQMMAIYGGHVALPLKKNVYVFAADHGITDEGVSAYPRSVTSQMVLNFLGGGAGINVLSRAHDVELSVVDVGVDAILEGAPGLMLRSVRRGTRNMLYEAAMTEDELQRALAVGLELADAAQKLGCNLIAAGEMGIGNTAAASAITAVLTQQPVAVVTGKGTGLSSSAVKQKASVIQAVLERHFSDAVSKPDPLEVLRRAGGFELAAITGLVLGAASRRIPIVLDGFITTAAAAVAYAVEPRVKDYFFAGHISEEPGHRFLLEYIGLEPFLSLGMRLGEGTGAVLAMPLMESALRLYTEMATFASAGVSTANT
jgi:nicotinate-nucleotide--dimethylbenzimidazole phosphoribosyltransferase